MEIEQRPPEHANFKLIVGLFAATIVVVLIAAIFFLHGEAKSLPSGKGHQRTPGSSFCSAVERGSNNV